MALPVPWNLIETTLREIQDFDQGAQKLSDFFKGKEERNGPDELLEIFFLSDPPQKIIERLLFSLFDIGVPDRQIGTRALQVRRLKRLWMRARNGTQLTETEKRLTEQTGWMFDQDPNLVDAALNEARLAFQRLINNETLSDSEKHGLSILIGSEAEALRDRVNWLSENADPYNMATMARILPRLRIYDEAVHEGMDLAKRQGNGEPLGLRVLSFESHMKGSTLDKWLKKISATESLKRLAELIEIQRAKKIPTLDLIALATLCRWTWEAREEKSGPLDWIGKAMESYHDGEFSVDAGEAIRILSPALSGSGARAVGRFIVGNFGLKSFPGWMGRDLLTKSYLKATDEGSLNMKAVLAQNITRDSILDALLSNPKVFQTPGLVGFVVSVSRSLAILSKIAKSRELTSGFANRDVPLALLQSPCNIPISLLRSHISVRNVSLIDLKGLVRTKTGVRREIKEECAAYLKSLS